MLKNFFDFLATHKKVTSGSFPDSVLTCLDWAYSCVLNTSHTVLGDMPDFYQKLVCITRHVIQFYQRPGWNTEHTNSLLM